MKYATILYTGVAVANHEATFLPESIVKPYNEQQWVKLDQDRLLQGVPSYLGA